MRVYAEIMTLSTGHQLQGQKWSEWYEISKTLPELEAKILLDKLVQILPIMGCTSALSKWAQYTSVSKRISAIAILTTDGVMAAIAKAPLSNIEGLERKNRTTIFNVYEDVDLPLRSQLNAQKKPKTQAQEWWGVTLEWKHLAQLERVAFTHRDGTVQEAFGIPMRSGPIPVVFKDTLGAKFYPTNRNRVQFLRDSCWINQIPSSSDLSKSVPDDLTLN